MCDHFSAKSTEDVLIMLTWRPQCENEPIIGLNLNSFIVVPKLLADRPR